MTGLQTALAERATEALRAAHVLLDNQSAAAAANRLYYAAFYMASAALAGEGDVPKTHAGVLRLFQARFIATGRISAETGRIAAQAFNFRQRADYEAFVVTDAAETAQLLSDVEQFVKAVRALLD